MEYGSEGESYMSAMMAGIWNFMIKNHHGLVFTDFQMDIPLYTS